MTESRDSLRAAIGRLDTGSPGSPRPQAGAKNAPSAASSGRRWLLLLALVGLSTAALASLLAS